MYKASESCNNFGPSSWLNRLAALSTTLIGFGIWVYIYILEYISEKRSKPYSFVTNAMIRKMRVKNFWGKFNSLAKFSLRSLSKMNTPFSILVFTQISQDSSIVFVFVSLWPTF